MKMFAKYHGTLSLDKVADDYILDANAQGWTKATHTPGWFTSATYFDLAGMTNDMSTVFFEGMTTQQQGYLAGGSGIAAGDQIFVYDIMTSIPVDIESGVIAGDILLRGLGFPGSSLNFEHVLYSRFRRYVADVDTAASMFLLSEDQQAGSMEPTASDRIYSYRVVYFLIAASDAAQLYAPPVRHLLRANVTEEKEYEYMMRLKRSYDLQQTDRD
ncbi:MAG: hypothetical protein ACR2NF_02695 [Pirellulales bacterium]